MKTPTPREILEELCGYQWDCLDARVSAKEDEWGGREYIDEALSALRECVLAKKITKSCPYSNIKCCTMQDYSKNQALQDIANLFGGEKSSKGGGENGNINI